MANNLFLFVNWARAWRVEWGTLGVGRSCRIPADFGRYPGFHQVLANHFGRGRMDYADAAANYIGNRNGPISAVHASSVDADTGVVAVCRANDLRYNHHTLQNDRR